MRMSITLRVARKEFIGCIPERWLEGMRGMQNQHRTAISRSRTGRTSCVFGFKVFIALVQIAAVSFLVLTGCGPSTDRLEISGKVLLDGAPLDGGSIRFTSLESEQLLVSGAMVQDGEFSIAREKGLRPGMYHLEISAPDQGASLVIAGEAPGLRGIPVAPERIPSEYNVNSQQKIEVTISGDNHFVFDIVSKPAG
jgi:hypothetical protein